MIFARGCGFCEYTVGALIDASLLGTWHFQDFTLGLVRSTRLRPYRTFHNYDFPLILSRDSGPADLG